ncbi:hypothetical protein [Spirosoma validum]|uniref:Uncharacterized protein n=1 Tax=Spirosoma validum TaxID=2771355 RepID=A0A927GCB7_9BACT|nr:hypothetical protein [Spirosoma validum]MBD2752499.1 hypothetical protein [Spirosoma validum]
MIESIKNYVHSNSVPLFECDSQVPLKAIFDKQGFSFSKEASEKYALVKNRPHLYVAYTDLKERFYYVGKSFQAGGRWKKQHAYHLGTLAHHLLGTIRYDDQNHQHWIKSWMDIETVQTELEPYSIYLKGNVFISFVPFELYSNTALTDPLDKPGMKDINKSIERQLIESYRREGYTLLNVHHNILPI